MFFFSFFSIELYTLIPCYDVVSQTTWISTIGDACAIDKGQTLRVKSVSLQRRDDTPIKALSFVSFVNALLGCQTVHGIKIEREST